MPSSTSVALMTALVAAAVLLAAYNPVSVQEVQIPKSSSSVPSEVVAFNPYLNALQCTEALAVQCVVDIEMTVKHCAAAFETQGTDIIADIKCAKDLLADKKHCWPCICYEAKQRGWKVLGC